MNPKKRIFIIALIVMWACVQMRANDIISVPCPNSPDHTNWYYQHILYTHSESQAEEFSEFRSGYVLAFEYEKYHRAHKWIISFIWPTFIPHYEILSSHFEYDPYPTIGFTFSNGEYLELMSTITIDDKPIPNEITEQETEDIDLSVSDVIEYKQIYFEIDHWIGSSRQHPELNHYTNDKTMRYISWLLSHYDITWVDFLEYDDETEKNNLLCSINLRQPTSPHFAKMVEEIAKSNEYPNFGIYP